MLAYAVVRRQREIGIRVALGADRSSVVMAVLVAGLRGPRDRRRRGRRPRVGHRPVGVVDGARRVAARAVPADRDRRRARLDRAGVLRGTGAALAQDRSTDRVARGVTMCGRCSRDWLDLVLRRRRDDRLDEEVEAHLDLLADEHIARGMSPADARLAARKSFGGVDQIKIALSRTTRPAHRRRLDAGRAFRRPAAHARSRLRR